MVSAEVDKLRFMVYDPASNNILGEFEQREDAEKLAGELNALNPGLPQVEVIDWLHTSEEGER